MNKILILAFVFVTIFNTSCMDKSKKETISPDSQTTTLDDAIARLDSLKKSDPSSERKGHIIIPADSSILIKKKQK